MAYTPEQKAWLLQQSGYSPEQFDISDDGFIDPKPAKVAVQPAGMSNDMPQAKLPAPMGAGSTFVKEAIHAAPAAAVGGLGAAGGAWAGGAIGAFPALSVPTAGLSIPVGAFLGGIGGALLAGGKAAEVQGELEQKYAPEYTAQREANLAANPWSGMGGRLAALPVGGMNPSLLNVGKAVTGQSGHLANVGIGAALGAGIPVGQQLAQGKSLGDALTSQETIEGAIGGTLFNNPNAIGKRLGFHPVTEPTRATDPTAEPARLAAMRKELAARQMQGFEGELQTVPTERQFGFQKAKEELQAETEKVKLAEAKIKHEAAVEDLKKTIAENTLKAAPEQRPAPLVTTETGNDIMPDYTGTQEFDAMANAQPETRPSEIPRPEGMGKATVVGQNPDGTLILSVEGQKQNLTAATDPAQVKIKRNLDEQQIEAIQEKYDRMNQEADAAKTPEQIAYEKALKAKGITTEISPQTIAEAGAAAKSRGVDQKITPGLNDKGVPVKGTTWIPKDPNAPLQRIATEINPDNATLDTPGHEGMGHAFFEFLRKSPHKADRDLMKRYQTLAENTGVIDQLNKARVAQGKKPLDFEEYAATQQGFESIMRHPKMSNEGNWKQLYRDTKARIKTRLGNASEADYRRVIDYKWHNMPAFEKYFKIPGGTRGTGVSARLNQDNEGPPLPDRTAELEAIRKAGLGEEANVADIAPARQAHSILRDTKNPEMLRMNSEAEPKKSTVSPRRQAIIDAYKKHEEQLNKTPLAERQAAVGRVQGKIQGARAVETGSIETAIDARRNTPLGQRTPFKLEEHFDEIKNEPGFEKLSPTEKEQYRLKAFDDSVSMAINIAGRRIRNASFASGKDYRGLPSIDARREIIDRVRENILAEGMDKDGLKATIQRRASNELDKFIANRDNRTVSLNAQKGQNKEFLDDVTQDTETDIPENKFADVPDSEAEQVKMPVRENMRQEEAAPERVAAPKGSTKPVVQWHETYSRMLDDVTNPTQKATIESLLTKLEAKDPSANISEKEVLAMLKESKPVDPAAELEAQLEAAYAKQDVLKETGEVDPELDAEIAALDRQIDNARKGFKRQNQEVDEPGFERKNQESDTPATDRYIPGIAPEVEKLRAINPVAGAGAHDFLTKFRGHIGAFEQTLIRAINKARPFDFSVQGVKDWIKQDNVDNQAVVKYRNAKQDGEEPGFELTPVQQKINDAVNENLALTHTEREAREGLATGRGQKDNYLPAVMNREVTNVLTEKMNSPEYNRYKNDFIEYRTSDRRLEPQTPEEALLDWQTIRGGFTLQQKADRASQFGAIDKAMGKGLPVSMRETNLQDLMSRFNKRTARRIAYYDAIESKPEVTSAFFDKEQGVASTAVGKNVVEDIFGIRDYEEGLRNAASGLVRAGMMGTLTGSKDVISGQVLGLQHMGLDQVLPAKTSSLVNWRSNYERAIKSGVIRHSTRTLETGDTGTAKIHQILGRVADVVNVAQGRTLLENVSRTLNFGEGVSLTQDALVSLSKGQLTGARREFLENFMPDWHRYRNGDVPETAINEAAARYVESVQGTYDYRGLPAIAQKGSLALPLSLARWNIEKFNNFTKHVVTPATKGNYRPLLMSTVGMLIGGVAVNALVEEITGRKSRVPNFKEVEASKNQMEMLSYKLAALASMSGYTGVMGDVAMAGLNYHYGNKVQTWSNPLLSGLGTVAEEMGFLTEALASGDLPKATDVISMILSDHLQAYRLAEANVSGDKQKKIEETNKRRDLKVYEMGQGLAVAGSEAKRPNPLIDADAREFKQTDDMQKAMQLVGPLIQRAIEKANGNPEKLKEEFSKLKRNSYQTVPSPELNPMKFSGYTSWLNKTQGQDETQKRITDYMMRNAKNKAKSSMIPSL